MNVIINAYSARNAGDAAIMLATASLIRQYSNEAVVISSRYHREDAGFYGSYGIDVCPPVIPFPARGKAPVAWRGLIFLIGCVCAFGLALTYKLRKSLAIFVAKSAGMTGLSVLFTSGRVIVAGGGYLYSSRQRLNLTLLHQVVNIRLASLLGKHVVMMPQSIGPFRGSRDICIAAWGLRGLSPIVVREPESLDFARQVAWERAEILLCPDIAFHRWDNLLACSAVDVPARSGKTIGLVVMDWTWARGSQADLATYVEKLVRTVDELAESGFDVLIAGHSRLPEHNQDDYAVAEGIEAKVKHQDRCRVARLDGSLEALCAFYRSCDLIIGTRLHSCILALTEGVPAIALAYQPKAVGTFAMLGIADQCFDVESFDVEELVSACRKVAEEEAKYRKKVERAVASARARIDEVYSDLA